MKKLLTLFAGVAVAATTIACDRSAETATGPEATPEIPAEFTKGPPNQTEYSPNTPSQLVQCNLVDMKLAKIPHGDGVAPATDAETGPGGWRFSNGGGSFVTFNYLWDGAQYDVVAGRSNLGGNTGIINDYPAVLDLPQGPEDDQLVFKEKSGEVVLSGGDLFQLPGQDNGQVRIPMKHVGMDGGDRIYEGCAKTPQLTNFGFTVKEGGDFVQQEYFKAWARTNGDHEVLEYEWTEVSTFKNTDPDAN